MFPFRRGLRGWKDILGEGHHRSETMAGLARQTGEFGWDRTSPRFSPRSVRPPDPHNSTKTEVQHGLRLSAHTDVTADTRQAARGRQPDRKYFSIVCTGDESESRVPRTPPLWCRWARVSPPPGKVVKNARRGRGRAVEGERQTLAAAVATRNPRREAEPNERRDASWAKTLEQGAP